MLQYCLNRIYYPFQSIIKLQFQSVHNTKIRYWKFHQVARWAQAQGFVSGHKVAEVFASLLSESAKSSIYFNSKQSLSVPITFDCPHYSSCISIRPKVSFVSPHHLPKFWGKKLKSNHYGDSNEPPITLIIRYCKHLYWSNETNINSLNILGHKKIM